MAAKSAPIAAPNGCGAGGFTGDGLAGTTASSKGGLPKAVTSLALQPTGRFPIGGQHSENIEFISRGRRIAAIAAAPRRGKTCRTVGNNYQKV
jgi:hypothetical protein